MKKYLLGIFAVVIALGLSSFTTVKKVETKTFDTNYYWFQVNNNEGDDPTLANSQVTYLSYGPSVAIGPCNEGDYNCRVGFNLSQVEMGGSGYQLKPNSHSIAITAFTRDEE